MVDIRRSPLEVPEATPKLEGPDLFGELTKGTPLESIAAPAPVTVSPGAFDVGTDIFNQITRGTELEQKAVQEAGKKVEAPPPQEEEKLPTLMGELGTGVVRGAKTTAGLGVAFAGTVAQLFGAPKTGEDLIQQGAQIIQEAEAVDPASVKTIEDAVESPGKFVRYAAGILGEQIPTIASIVLTGGAGGLVTRLAAKGVVGREIAKSTLRKATTRGAIAGTFTGATGLETGVSALEQVEAGFQADPTLSIGAGAVKGALEFITPFFIAGAIARRSGVGMDVAQGLGEKIFRAFGRKGLPTRIGVGVAGGMLTEGLTEGAQEAVDLGLRRYVDENFDVLSADARSRLLNAAAAGSIVGGAFGGAGGALLPQEALRTPPTKEDVERAATVPKGEDAGEVREAPPEIVVREGEEAAPVGGTVEEDDPGLFPPEQLPITLVALEEPTGQGIIPGLGITPLEELTAPTAVDVEADVNPGQMELPGLDGQLNLFDVVKEPKSTITGVSEQVLLRGEGAVEEFIPAGRADIRFQKSLGTKQAFRLDLSKIDLESLEVIDAVDETSLISRGFVNFSKVKEEDGPLLNNLIDDLNSTVERLNTIPLSDKRFVETKDAIDSIVRDIKGLGAEASIADIDGNIDTEVAFTVKGGIPEEALIPTPLPEPSFAARRPRVQTGSLLHFVDRITGDVVHFKANTQVRNIGAKLPPTLTKMAARLSNLTEAVGTKLLPNTQIVVQLSNELPISRLGDVTVFEDPKGFKGIIINLNKSALTTQADFVTTLSHELGHAIFTLEFRNAPHGVKSRILAAYDQWLNDIQFASGKEFAETALSPMPKKFSAFLGKAFEAEGRPKLIDVTNPDYWYSFDEWAAEQTARWMVTSKPAIGTVEKFFKGLAKRIRTVLRSFSLEPEKFRATEAVEEWLDSLFSRQEDGKTPLLSQEYTASMQQSSGENRRILDAPAETFIPPSQAESLAVKSVVASEVLSSVRTADGEGPKKIGAELDKFNWFTKTFWNIIQIAEKNRHIPGVAEYRELLDFWNNTKMRWISRADERVKEWSNLGKDMGDKLSRFMFAIDAQEFTTDEQSRWPTEAELSTLAEKFQLSAEALDVYNKVKNDFLAALDSIQESLEADAIQSFTDPLIIQTRIQEIREDIEKLKARPYFPHARFGQYSITVRDQLDNIVYMELTETEKGQSRRAEALKKEFPEADGFGIKRDRIPDEATVLRGLPTIMLKRMAEKLELSPAQLDVLEQLMFETSPAQSFKHRFERREGIAGYSLDGQRSYANYFFHGANHLARIRWGGELQDAIKTIEDGTNALRGADINVNKRRRLVDYLKRHFDYIMTPQNDWASVRSAAFQYWLGFSPVSAMINLTQVPMVAYPYLSKRFTDISTLNELKRAALDVHKLYKGNPRLAPDEMRAIDLAVEQAFIDESQATELAGVAEGDNLQRILPGTRLHRGVKQLGYASAWMFQNAEKINRRIVFRAGYRLAKANPDAAYLQELKEASPRLFSEMRENGFTEEEAIGFLGGKDAVLQTQFEYSSWARPEFVRGKKGTLFMFFMFKANMLHFALHAPGRAKFFLILLGTAGLMGMPGFEDMEAIVKFMAKQLFGVKFNIEKEIREFAKEVGFDKPDLLLHGVSRYGFGLPAAAQMIGVPFPNVDLSASLGQGSIVPGAAPALELLSGEAEFAGGFARSVEGVAGAGFGIPISILRAMTDDNPDQHKRWERVLPRALRGASKAVRFYQEEREKDRSGATVLRFDPQDPQQMAEILAQGLGFAPTRLTQKWDFKRFQQETFRYWQTRRGMLLTQLDYARSTRDREGIADTIAAVKRFNKEVRDGGQPSLSISGKTIRRSLRSRFKRRALVGKDIPVQKIFRPVGRRVQELFPEVFEEAVK